MSFYTPYRFATVRVPNRYSVGRFPWWNRYTITGTRTS